MNRDRPSPPKSKKTLSFSSKWGSQQRTAVPNEHRDDRKMQNCQTKDRGQQTEDQTDHADPSDKVTDLTEQLSKANEKIKEIQENSRKKDEAIIKLRSGFNQANLRGIPELENLNTENRSLKIRDRFEQDLYGTAWSEALEYLQKSHSTGEYRSIRLLYRILMVVYWGCVEQKQEDDLRNFLFALQNSPNHKKFVAMLEKKIANLAIRNVESTNVLQKGSRCVEMKVMAALSSPEIRAKDWDVSKLVSSQEVVHFIGLCGTLCGKMLVQDPPMVLHDDAHKGDDINLNYFDYYGRRGAQVDFIVWPALLLRQDGEVMARGFAKCESNSRQTRL